MENNTKIIKAAKENLQALAHLKYIEWLKGSQNKGNEILKQCFKIAFLRGSVHGWKEREAVFLDEKLK